MKVNPKLFTQRDEINLRQGIKSSLPNMKALFASVYTLFKISPTSHVIFSEETKSKGSTLLKIHNSFELALYAFYEKQLLNSEMSQSEFLGIFNSNPIFSAQLEALQVAIQLFWKLGEVNFVESMASSTERTGRNRYNKSMNFSTNLDIIDTVLTNDDGQIDEQTKNLIFNYLTNKSLPTSSKENKLKRTLTVFSEETQFKIRQNGDEIYFQQEGIYTELLNDNTVESADSHEPVGPFRILKSAIKDDLNFYINDSRADGFVIKDGITKEEISNYLTRVNSYLDLNPKKTNIEILQVENIDIEEHFPLNSINKIFYGAPGTGKSHKVKELVKGKEERTERVTFHPEYDYASFVGGYKPTMEGKDIRYEFVPQSFTKIYCDAWNSLSLGENLDFYLVIEEINRGNCAEIFGDIFQLLDRNSDYDISPSKELKEFLLDEKKGLFHKEFGLKGDKLKLPPNLNILATMNTSDQSLFPMDSAFKRRWDWEYIPINYDPVYIDFNKEEKENKSFSYIITDNNLSFKWIEFIYSINNNWIKTNDNLGMDKCLGNYFIKSEDSKISIDSFINKVVFYLWNDVFKDEDEEKSIFKNKVTYEDFFPVESNGIKNVKEILNILNVDFNEPILE